MYNFASLSVASFPIIIAVGHPAPAGDFGPSSVGHRKSQIGNYDSKREGRLSLFLFSCTNQLAFPNFYSIPLLASRTDASH